MIKFYFAIILLVAFNGCASIRTKCIKYEGKHCVAEEVIYIKRNS
mgnify:CR=1 FL=1